MPQTASAVANRPGGVAPAALTEPIRTLLVLIATQVAGTYGFATWQAIVPRPEGDEHAFEAWMIAVAIARNVLCSPNDRLARFFGGDAEAMAACGNRVAERCARERKFRTTVRYLTSTCIATLGLDSEWARDARHSSRGNSAISPHVAP